MRSWLNLAVLAAAVAALSAWVYYRPDAQRSETYVLSQLKAAEVTRIRLERAATATDASPSASDATPAAPAAAIILERRGEAWHITAPYAARADAFQVERLLSILEARSLGRFAATGLDRYGLAQPQSTVTLNGQSFAFGAVNSATREQYVLTDGAVYAIPLVQRTALPRDADALVSKALFAPHEAPARIELPQLVAALEDGTWKFTPAREDSSADERNAWAERWRRALAVRASRHDGKPAEDEVKVELKDGGRLTFAILQRDPELVLLRADEGIQYHFFAETAKRLLSAP